jgi:hypothetical protein
MGCQEATWSGGLRTRGWGEGRRLADRDLMGRRIGGLAGVVGLSMRWSR